MAQLNKAKKKYEEQYAGVVAVKSGRRRHHDGMGFNAVAAGAASTRSSTKAKVEEGEKVDQVQVQLIAEYDQRRQDTPARSW